MEGIRQYILSLVAVSVVCSIAKRVTGKDSAFASMIGIICGLFIAVTVLSPWIRIDFSDFDLFPESYYAQAKTIADSGKAAAQDAVEASIIEQTEAYILDKALSLGSDITVDVMLDDAGMIPYTVTIRGNASPYAKTVLRQYMANTLAISEERQRWM